MLKYLSNKEIKKGNTIEICRKTIYTETNLTKVDSSLKNHAQRFRN